MIIDVILKHKQKILNILLILILLSLAFLRLKNLGYSDYIPDETTVMDHYRVNGPILDLKYLVSQRKGPMQWLVVLTTNFIYKNVFNELVFRLPFALANILSIVFFYKFLEIQTENKKIAILGSFLFGVNGFMVAFGRIVQYQSLNLLFSTISLYLFSRYLKEGMDSLAFYGSAFFTFSLLSHWDAVFILPYIAWVFVKRSDLKLILYSIFITLIIFVPFFLPFLMYNLAVDDGHLTYFATRIGVRNSFNLFDVRFKNSLYNPFLFTPFVVTFALASLAWVRKYFIFWFWFVLSLTIFAFVVRAPGTHTYNIIIPLIIIASIGFVKLAELLPKDYQIIPFGLLAIICGFLYYQSYLLFTDLREEYPWEKEKIFRYETRAYDHANLTNNVIGFPHGRNWSDVRDYFNSMGSKAGGYTFLTNDNSAVASFYIDLDYAKSNKMYLIGVKEPYSFVSDYQFSQESSKYSIKSIENGMGEVVVKIYEKR